MNFQTRLALQIQLDFGIEANKAFRAIYRQTLLVHRDERRGTYSYTLDNGRALTEDQHKFMAGFSAGYFAAAARAKEPIRP